MNDRKVVFSLTKKRLLLLAFVFVILALLGYKSYDEGWFLPRVPLDLDGQPAVLFFNRHKGCECAVVIYDAAAHQIAAWPETQRHGVKLIQIDLDRRPDLGTQFDVTRAPTLLLLDMEGNTRYRQDDVVTDLEPFNLVLLEQKIKEVIDGN